MLVLNDELTLCIPRYRKAGSPQATRVTGASQWGWRDDIRLLRNTGWGVSHSKTPKRMLEREQELSLGAVAGVQLHLISPV